MPKEPPPLRVTPRGQTRLRPSRTTLWRWYVKNRWTADDLAGYWAVDRKTVYRWLHHYDLVELRAGIEARAARLEKAKATAKARRKRTLAEEKAARRARGLKQREPEPYDRDDLREMAKILSVTELAAHYGVHRHTLRSRLQREGIKAVSGHRPAHPPRKELMRLRRRGWSYAKIGEKYGVSRQRVHQWLSPSS